MMRLSEIAALLAILLSVAATAQDGVTTPKSGTPAKVHAPPHTKAQAGKASYYAPSLAGKKMADGKPLDLSSNAAASKTLPLGSSAKVTNLQNGKTATVKIEDRGPYVGNRALDVTPETASKLDMKTTGTAAVKIEPVNAP